MEESQRKKIEDKLRRMMELENQSNREVRQIKNIPPGTRVIRRRKGSPDKHIF